MLGKRIFQFMCVLGAMAFLLGSCNRSGSGTNGGDGPIKLVVWDDKSSKEEARVIKAIIEKWNAENPDVIVEREAVDIESYKMKLKTVIAADEAPDVFYSYGAGFSKPFVEAGKILELGKYLSSDIKDSAMPETWNYVTYNGKTYGLPIYMWCGVLYCNQELFDKYGIKIPETYEEFIDAVKSFRANGMGAVGVGASEKWTGMFYHNILALRTAGADLCNKALSGEAGFDTPEFMDAAVKLDELVKLKAFNDGYSGLNYDDFTLQFKEGLIPMIYQGNWLAGDLEADDCPVKGKIVVKNFPSIAGGKGSDTEFLGGAIDVYMVSNSTKHKEAAVKLLEYICKNYSREGYATGLGLPVYKDPDLTTKVDRLTKDITDLVGSATGFVLSWDTFLEGEAADTHNDLVQELIIGTKTPAQFTEGMSEINQ